MQILSGRVGGHRYEVLHRREIAAEPPEGRTDDMIPGA
jgi:hypothetical protein